MAPVAHAKPLAITAKRQQPVRHTEREAMPSVVQAERTAQVPRGWWLAWWAVLGAWLVLAASVVAMVWGGKARPNKSIWGSLGLVLITVLCCAMPAQQALAAVPHIAAAKGCPTPMAAVANGLSALSNIRASTTRMTGYLPYEAVPVHIGYTSNGEMRKDAGSLLGQTGESNE